MLHKRRRFLLQSSEEARQPGSSDLLLQWCYYFFVSHLSQQARWKLNSSLQLTKVLYMSLILYPDSYSSILSTTPIQKSLLVIHSVSSLPSWFECLHSYTLVESPPLELVDSFYSTRYKVRTFVYKIKIDTKNHFIILFDASKILYGILILAKMFFYEASRRDNNLGSVFHIPLLVFNTLYSFNGGITVIVTFRLANTKHL